MNKEDREKMFSDIMNRKRTYTSIVNDSASLNASIGDAEDELNKLLEKNQKDIEELTKQVTGEVSESDFAKLQEEINRDFGIKTEVQEKAILGKDNKEVFERIAENLKKAVIGQNEAAEAMALALRRPYVVGSNIKNTRNSIIVTGSNGTGRHLLVTKAAQELKKEGLTVSGDVSNINMSRYQNSSQEILFLQDLYVALNAKTPIIMIENFEASSSVFNRMLAELVMEGKCLLSKRYSFTNGQLTETTGRLSSNVIDSLNGNDKILVFVTELRTSKLMDIFGKSFVDYIVDKVETKKLDEESLKQIVSQEMEALIQKCHTQLEIELTVEDKVQEYLISQYEPNDGIDSITPFLKKIYDCLVNVALNNEVNKIDLVFTDKIVAKYNETETDLKIFDDSNKEREEIQKELDEIVGLDEVKEYLLSLEDHLRINQIRKQKGLKVAELSKHMVFTGNPGTGKTTIARLISRLMKACGILKQGQLVEVTRADLVGKYVGHTAPLTMQVIESALGGVLFIDEAYSLYRGKDDSFGLEAIDTLVKAMEDHRDDLIVILAGYSREMSEFLTANSGLKSRFANIIDFKDYTGEELMKISVSIAKGKDYRIEEAALKPLEEYFTKIQARADATSGNGRLARNLVEEAILKQAKRLLNDDDGELDLLKLEDFDLEIYE